MRKNFKKHENYKELIWILAKTDFKLRYQGSVLGYIWALLGPLLLFLILNFVFSSIFNPRNTGTEYFSLQLITSLMLFNFFAEGTKNGLITLKNKSNLVTKIYIPRWTIILASTLNSVMIFSMNLIVVFFFFLYYQFAPSLQAVGMFFLFALFTYALVLAFALVAAPLFLRFRDLQQIWEVIILGMFYATPIVYPLSILPEWVHKIILLNPLAFIIHHIKVGLIENRFPSLNQMLIFIAALVVICFFSFFFYKKMEKKIAETV
jgi:ABC-type polysaccharide/polyol phosphate export permease